MTLSRIIGRDWSLWKYINYDQAVQDPSCQFVILKLSQGTFKDPKYDQHHEGLAGRVPEGGYHFYEPTVNIPQQVETCKKFMRGKGPVVFDLEGVENFDRRLITDLTIQFLKETANWRGERAGLYCGYNTLQSVLLPNRMEEVIPEYAFLWLAWPWKNAQKYGLEDMSRRPTPVIAGYPQPTIWQFDWWDRPKWAASKKNHLGQPYNWGETKVDLNRWEGTIEEFNTIFNLGTQPTPPVFTNQEKLDSLWEYHPELHQKGVR